MHAIVDTLNSIVTTLSRIDPTFYVVLVGPIANIMQHLLKKEAAFAQDHGLLVALTLAALGGAFFGIMHTNTVQGLLTDTALIGSPIYVVANLLFQAVSQKLEKSNDATGAVVVPAAPASVPEPAQI